MTKGEMWFMYSVVLILLTLIIGVVSCNIHMNAAVTDMVNNGANPILARCSVGGGTEIVCSRALRDITEAKK